MHYLFVCTMKFLSPAHGPSLSSLSHTHRSTVYYTFVHVVSWCVCLVAHLILDYQTKEWQVLLQHASGFGGGRWCLLLVLEASLHEGGSSSCCRTPAVESSPCFTIPFDREP